MKQQTSLTILSLSAFFIMSCKREITARPEPAAARASALTSSAVFSGSNDRYTIQAEVTSLLAGQVFSGYQDGTGRNAQFNFPTDVATDASGNIYIADASNHRIRKSTPAGVVTTYAGNGSPTWADGPSPVACFNYPTSVAFGPDGSLYVADQGNNRIRKISPDGSTVSTVAGTGVAGFADGPGATAKFNAPAGIAVDPAGMIYVADYGNHRIRRIATTGVVSQWVGDGTPGYKDGSGALAELNHPISIAVGAGGAVYVADLGNNRIRKIVSGVTSTIAGGNNTIYIPTGVATDAAGNIFVADYGRIRKITPAGVMTNLVGHGYLDYYDSYDTLAAIDPWGLTIDAGGNIYVAEKDNGVIRKITPTPAVRTLAGNSTAGYQEGVGATASFKNPIGLAIDAGGNIYISDADDNRIRKITPNGVTSFLAGSGQPGNIDGVGAQASFNQPAGIAVDAAGNVYVADEGNASIRKITPNGAVTTFANRATGLKSWPTTVAVDGDGNVYPSGPSTDTVVKISPNGIVTVIGRLKGHTLGHTFYPSSVSSIAWGPGLLIGDAELNAIWSGSTSGPFGISYQGDSRARVVSFCMAMDNDGKVFVINNDKISWIQRETSYPYPDGTPMQLIPIAGSTTGFADGPTLSAKFNGIGQFAFGPNGLLYVADGANHRIRVLSK